MLLLPALLALFLHESAHALVARRLGYTLQKFSLTPFGATLSYESGLSGSDELIVTVAGPLSNLVVCLLLVASWWIFPTVYPITLALCRANLTLALYNLLPVFPFDGGRIVLSLCRDKKKAYSVLRIVGIVLSILLAVLGIYLFFRGWNFSLPIASFCIFWVVLFPPEDARYKIIFDQMGVFFDKKPFVRQDIYVRSDQKVGVLLRAFRKKNVFYVVHILYPNKPETILSPEKINRLFFADRRLELKDVL